MGGGRVIVRTAHAAKARTRRAVVECMRALEMLEPIGGDLQGAQAAIVEARTHLAYAERAFTLRYKRDPK